MKKSKPGYGIMFWILWFIHLAFLIRLFSSVKITAPNVWYAGISGIAIYAYMAVTWWMRTRSTAIKWWWQSKELTKQEKMHRVVLERPISVPPPVVGRNTFDLVQKYNGPIPLEGETVFQDGERVTPPDWDEATQGPYVPFNVNHHRPTGRQTVNSVQEGVELLDKLFKPR